MTSHGPDPSARNADLFVRAVLPEAKRHRVRQFLRGAGIIAAGSVVVTLLGLALGPWFIAALTHVVIPIMMLVGVVGLIGLIRAELQDDD